LDEVRQNLLDTVRGNGLARSDDNLVSGPRDPFANLPPLITTSKSGVSPAPGTTPLPVSDQARKWAERQQADAEGPGFFRTLSNSVKVDWVTSWAFQSAPDFAPDPDFKLTRQKLEELGKGLPDDYLEYFRDAHSEAHALSLRQRALDTLKIEEELNAAGVSALPLRFLVSMFDPLSLLATAATSGGLAPFIAGAKASRLARAGYGALAGAATNVGLTAIQDQFDPSIGTDDYLLSAGLGITLGAAFGPLGRNPATAKEAAEARKLGNDLITGKRPPGPTGGGGVGAQRVATKSELGEIFSFSPEDAPKSAFSGVRFSVTAQSGSSEIGLERALTHAMFPDNVGYTDKTIAVQGSAWEKMGLLHRTAVQSVESVYQPAYEEWLQLKGYGLGKRATTAWEEFGSEVSDFISLSSTNPFANAAAPQPVIRAANALRDAYEKFNKLANNPLDNVGQKGKPVEGWGDVPSDRNYQPRYYDTPRVSAMIDRFGEERVARFFGNAIKVANPQLGPRNMTLVGRGMLSVLRKADVGMQHAFFKAMHIGDRQFFYKSLDDLGITEQPIKNALANALGFAKKGGNPHAMRRQLLDETHGEWFTPPEGGAPTFVKFSELLERDAFGNFVRYAREMSGAIALASVRIVARNGDEVTGGITGPEEFSRLLDSVRAAASQKSWNKTKTDRHVARLQYMYDRIMGVPAEGSDSVWGKTLNRVDRYNYARVGANMGIAQIPEAMNLMGTLGVTAMLSSMPSFRRIVNERGSRRFHNELAHELEIMIGPTVETRAGGLFSRLDDFGDFTQPGADTRTGQYIDRALNAGVKITNTISFTEPITRFTSQATGKAAAHWLANAAFGKKVSAQRMKYYGFTDAMQKRVFEQIRKHASRERGAFTSNKVTQLNIDNWDDLEAFHTVQIGLQRIVRQVIQQNDPGAIQMWMNKPLGKTFLQFRKFAIVAWEKQTLHNLHMADWQAAQNLMLSMFMGAVTYAVWTKLYMAASGNYKDEAKRLSPQAIALAGFQRSGLSSLMPMAVDMVTALTGQKPVFDYRSSLQASDPILGIPATSLIDAIANLTGTSIDPWIDDRIASQQEVRGASRALPWTNWLPFVSLLSMMIEDRPQFKPKER
jgi:hypothetical protein